MASQQWSNQFCRIWTPTVREKYDNQSIFPIIILPAIFFYKMREATTNFSYNELLPTTNTFRADHWSLHIETNRNISFQNSDSPLLNRVSHFLTFKTILPAAWKPGEISQYPDTSTLLSINISGLHVFSIFSLRIDCWTVSTIDS